MFPEGRFLEFALVAIVALVVVGPKDLPVLLRTLGRFMAKVRGMAAEFRASFDEMARQSELDELRKEVEAMRQGQMADIAGSAGSDTQAAFTEIHQGLTDVGVDLHPATTYPYGSAQTAADLPVMTGTAKPRVRKPAAKTTVTKAPAVKAVAARARAAPKAAAPKPAAPKAAPKAAAKSPAAKPGKAAPSKAAPPNTAPPKANAKPRVRKTVGS